MAKTEETIPCCNCGRPTYSDSEEPGIIFCSESEVSVLVCDATPIWKEEAQANADYEENERRSKTSEEPVEAK